MCLGCEPLEMGAHTHTKELGHRTWTDVHAHSNLEDTIRLFSKVVLYTSISKGEFFSLAILLTI